MLTVNITLNKIEVANFERLSKTVTFRLYYNNGNDEVKELAYVPEHPEQGSENIMNMLKQAEKASRREQGDLDDPFAGIVHVIFNNEEKTYKTLCSFLTLVNDKLFYLNRTKEAADHMRLAQVLMTLKQEF